MNRRQFIKTIGLTLTGLILPTKLPTKAQSKTSNNPRFKFKFDPRFGDRVVFVKFEKHYMEEFLPEYNNMRQIKQLKDHIAESDMSYHQWPNSYRKGVFSASTEKYGYSNKDDVINLMNDIIHQRYRNRKPVSQWTMEVKNGTKRKVRRTYFCPFPVKV